MPLGNFFRNRLDSIRTHPIQNLLSGVAGTVIPGGGLLAQRGFDAYNNRQFNNSADQSYQGIGDEIGRTSRNIWDKPIDGPLQQKPDVQDQNRQLGNALTGGYGNPGGFNMSQQWQNPSGFTGGSSAIDSILNQLPGSPGFKPDVGQPAQYQGGGQSVGGSGMGSLMPNYNGGSWSNGGFNGNGMVGNVGSVGNIGMALQALQMMGGGGGNRELTGFGGFGPNTLR